MDRKHGENDVPSEAVTPKFVPAFAVVTDEKHSHLTPTELKKMCKGKVTDDIIKAFKMSSTKGHHVMVKGDFHALQALQSVCPELQVKIAKKWHGQVMLLQVDPKLTEEDICSQLQQSVSEVTDVRRVRKGGEPTKLVRVHLESKEVEMSLLSTGKMILNGRAHRCDQVKESAVYRCFRCTGRNHSEAKCKATAPKCTRCAGPHHGRTCKNAFHCANCGGDHGALSYLCKCNQLDAPRAPSLNAISERKVYVPPVWPAVSSLAAMKPLEEKFDAFTLKMEAKYDTLALQMDARLDQLTVMVQQLLTLPEKVRTLESALQEQVASLQVQVDSLQAQFNEWVILNRPPSSPTSEKKSVTSPLCAASSATRGESAPIDDASDEAILSSAAAAPRSRVLRKAAIEARDAAKAANQSRHKTHSQRHKT